MTAQRKSRGRSKLGCGSCRNRRVKCDEQYPTCGNCSKKGLRCDGVHQLVFTNDAAVEHCKQRASPESHNSLIRKISPLASRSTREIRAFKWLVARSASDATNAVDRNFWAKAVPSVAQADDMVWYGVAALSTLFEHPPTATSRIEPFADMDSGEFYRRQALEWYGRSLQAAHKTTRSTPILTLSTFIFACIEMLQGRPQVGLKLMYQAFQINEGDREASSADLDLLEAVLPYLFRCLLPLSIFGFDLSPEQRDRAKLHKTGCEVSAESITLHLMIDLYDLAYQIQKFCNAWAGTAPDDGAVRQKESLITQMLDWHIAVKTAGVLQSTGETRRFLSQQLVVYHAAFIRLSCLWDTALDVFEPYEDHFRIIVAESEKCLALADVSEKKIPFDLSVVPCLYYTAWACRRPRLRRKALALLRHRAPREENLWTADACISLMEAAIACEEGTDRFMADVAEANDVYPPLEMRLPVAGQVARMQMLIHETADKSQGLPLSSLKMGLPWKGDKELPSSPFSNLLPYTFWRV